MDTLRAELRRVCESTPLWSEKVCNLQISNAKEHTLELRALMDVRNSSNAWDLRCLVRETHRIPAKNYPGSLPRYRGEFDVPSMERAGRPGELGQRRTMLNLPKDRLQLRRTGCSEVGDSPRHPFRLESYGHTESGPRDA